MRLLSRVTVTMICAGLLVAGLGSSAMAKPNTNSEAQIEFIFQDACTRVGVTASALDDAEQPKNISYVTVYFVDGTSVKIKAIKEPTFRYRSLGAAIESVTAKSGTTVASADCIV